MRAPDASKFIRDLCAGPDAPAPQSATQPLLVKICGTRSAEAASEAINAGADLVGMILVPGTKRCVSDETALAISEAVHSARKDRTASDAVKIPQAATDFFSLSGEVLRKNAPLLVGVFMNQPLEEVLEKQRRYNLDVVQLHGDEPLEWASLIPVPVIRKFKPGQIGVGVRGYHALPLLDSGAGCGKLLDTEAVKGALGRDQQLSVLLAGGLAPDNVVESVAALGPLAEQVLGVDVSSGVEVDGQQSLEKIRAFVKAAKAIR
jgi:anthranilate synthase/indole-3-glycerol phosphate synthase/phosphoribosylanthranilate isomerase